MTILECSICGKEFDNTTGRFLLDGRKYCWRCRLKDICEGNHRDSETWAERDRIKSRFEILDL